MLATPTPSTTPYIINGHVVYGYPAVLATNSNLFPRAIDAWYYRLTTPIAHPRPFMWIWYHLNNVTPSRQLTSLDDVLEAYDYITFFDPMPSSDVRQAWWELIDSKDFVFPDYTAPRSGHYRENLLAITTQAKNTPYLPLLPDNRFDRRYLGLYPPGERVNVTIPSLGTLQRRPAASTTTISAVVIFDNTYNSFITVVGIGISHDESYFSDMIKAFAREQIPYEVRTTPIGAIQVVTTWGGDHYSILIGLGDRWFSFHDGVPREIPKPQFYLLGTAGTQSVWHVIAARRAIPRESGYSLPFPFDIIPSHLVPVKRFALGTQGLILWGYPLVMRKRSPFIASLDDTLISHTTAIMTGDTIIDIRAIRYLWSYLNGLMVLSPPRTVRSWLALWMYSSYFAISLATSFIRTLLDRVPAPGNEMEKNELRDVFSSIPLSVRATVRLFVGDAMFRRDSRADALTGGSFTYQYGNQRVIPAASLKVGDIALISRGGHTRRYNTIITSIDRGLEGASLIASHDEGGVRSNVTLISDTSARWLLINALGDIIKYTLVDVVFVEATD